MNLVEITKSLRRHHHASLDDINVGWVSWSNNDQKTSFSEGVTIIENESLRYVAYVVCVKDDNKEEVTTDEEDVEIPMTPMFSAKNLNINSHTSIPESPEGSDDDTDDSEIIMSSQQMCPTKKKQPKVPKTPTTTNTDSVFWNSSTQSPSFNLHLEDSAVNESEIPQIEDNIHDALTQVIPIEEDDAEIDSSIHIQEQQSKIIPSHKSFHEQETQIIPNDKIHSIHDQETQVIPKGIEMIHEQETQEIPKKIIYKHNKEMKEEEEGETIGALEIGVMNKRNKEIVTEKKEMRGNTQEKSIVDEQNPKLLFHKQETQMFKMPPINAPKQTVNIENPDISANESDHLMADSEICNFDIDEESEAPDSPDSMSLLEIENITQEGQNKSRNSDIEVLDECDPYDQDTEIMDPIIPPLVQSSSVDNEDDELTQVLDDHLILPRHIFLTQTQQQKLQSVTGIAQKGIDKPDMFKISQITDGCLDSLPDEIIFSKPTSIVNSGIGDLTQEKVQTVFDFATQKAMVTQEANILDLPTQKIDILEVPTQEVNILKLPTKNKNKLDMPTQKDNILDMLTQKIDHQTNTKKVINVKMSGNTKDVSPKDNTQPVQKLSSNDFKIGSSLSNHQLLRSNKSYITPIKRQVLAESNSFSFSTPANVEKKKKVKASDTSFDASVITLTINQLNSSSSSMKSINTDEENYYNNTGEIEDDLLSQTVVSVSEKSPATSKTFTTPPSISAAGGKNYYGCTQDIMEDLLTQKLDCSNISPVKPSPVQVSPLQKRDTVFEKTNENKNYYAFTQDIVNELLTQEEPQLDLQEPSFEKCSTDLLFSKLPKPISFSQLSDSGSEIFEVTPLKRFRNTISDSELDSPQIKNFALRGQPLQNSSSDNELEEDSNQHTEEDEPIVHRRAVPKKKPKNQPVEVKQKPPPIIEAKQTRISTRVRKDVARLIEQKTDDKSATLSLKNKPKVLRRTSVYIERLPDDLVVGVSTRISSNSVTEKSDKSIKKKAKQEIETIIIEDSQDLPSTSNVKPSIIEKRGGQNSSGKQELKPSSDNNSDIDKQSGEGTSKTKKDSCSKDSDNPETSVVEKRKRVSNRRAKKEPASSVPEKINHLFGNDDSLLLIENSAKASRDNKVNESSKRISVDISEAPVTEKRGRGSRCKISKNIDTNNSSNPEEGGKNNIKKETRASNSPATELKQVKSITASKITDKREDSVPKKISANESAFKKIVEANERTSRREVEKPAKNSERKRPADPENEVRDATLKRARPHSRQRKVNIKHIMLTQITDLKSLEVIPKLGGKVVDQGGDVLVMGGSKRTVKLMVAIAQGIPVVSQSWLTASKQMESFQDPWKFILNDKELEKKFKFNLNTAINTAHPYLSGWVIYLTPKILPSPQEMKTLIEASGGKVVLVSGLVGRRSGNTAERGSQGTFTVSCKEDRHIWPSLPCPINNTEAIMLGAIHHKLIKGYQIDEESK